MFIKSAAWKWHRIICTSLFNNSFEYLVCPCYNKSSPIHHFPILTLTITYNCFSKQILHITYLFKVSDMHLHFHFLLYTSVFPSLVPVYSFTLNKYLTSAIFILPFLFPNLLLLIIHTISIYCMFIPFFIKSIQAMIYFPIPHIFVIAYRSNKFSLHFNYLLFLIWLNIPVLMSLECK